MIERILKAVAAAGVVAALAWWGIDAWRAGPPGDYETRQGDIVLSDGKWDQAVARFDAALAKSPDHPGAMMGRAIALMQAGRDDAAEAAFTTLIQAAGKAGDAPPRFDVLAAALANRGILYDRTGRYDKALADYRAALVADAEAVAGPGLVDRVLYGTPNPATVAGRAEYLERQLALPPERRVLSQPAIDGAQRMHKP